MRVRSRSSFRILIAASNAGLSRSGKSIGVSPSDQHRASAEANRLCDIAAAAHAAIHQDFDLAADRFHDLRQRMQRGRDAVQLASAVV